MDATPGRDDRTPAYAADGGEDEETPLQQAAAGAVTLLVLLVAFGLMFAGFEFFWVAFVVGFGGLLPVVVALTRWHESRRDAGRGARRRGDADATGAETEGALETLRDRYARGDVDEAEFERRLDALLRTESVDDARADAERRAAERTRERERAREAERDREPEYDRGG